MSEWNDALESAAVVAEKEGDRLIRAALSADAALSQGQSAQKLPFGDVSLPVAAQQRIWEFCYDIASHAQTLPEPMARVFFQRAKDIAILFEGVSADTDLLPRGLQSAFKWKCERPDAALSQQGVVETPWRCFHCDETFTDRAEASEHFGYMEDGACEGPACKLTQDEKGIVGLLRQAWAELRGYHEEDTKLIREVYALSSKHETERREWGDKEYAKGLADGRTEPAAPQAQVTGARIAAIGQIVVIARHMVVEQRYIPTSECNGKPGWGNHMRDAIDNLDAIASHSSSGAVP